jgi:spore maturation protein SpmA/spore maturation protein SpmB
MLNAIWLGMMMIGLVVASFTGRLEALTTALISGGKSAVMDICLPVAGIFTLMMGVMRLVEKSGLITRIARFFRPLLRLLFPDIPADHPALGAMMMNIAANFIGAGNAATPFGLRAMHQLQRLNPQPGTATNAMCTFLLLNTAALTLVSTTGLFLLKEGGSKNPSLVIAPTLISTVIALIIGILIVKTLEKLPLFAVRAEPSDATAPAADAEKSTTPSASAPAAEDAADTIIEPLPLLRGSWLIFLAFGALFIYALTAILGGVFSLASLMTALSHAILPFFICFLILYAALARVPVFETFVEGGKEGIQTALRIIPYLVAMIVGIKMLRESRTIDLITSAIQSGLGKIGASEQIIESVQLLPMILMRPLSGSGSQAVLADLIKTHGPDHWLSLSATAMYGSTETTFYVLAVYFGAVGIRRSRHALLGGLCADAIAMTLAIFFCRWAMA